MCLFICKFVNFNCEVYVFSILFVLGFVFNVILF